MLFFSPELLLLSLWLGLALDYFLGEPRRWHPLVGFGFLASQLELRLNSPSSLSSTIIPRVKGCFAWGTLVLPIPLVLLVGGYWASAQGDDVLLWGIWLLINGLLLWFAVGAKSLIQHLEQIKQPLEQGDLDEARTKVSWIVSRDTRDMDEHRVTRAAIESGLENGSDAIYAPLFWFLLGGAPLVLLYRFANTLDAMWGYKTERYLSFGWAAARIDDLLNWLPARFCAFIYALSGVFSGALHCWYKQGSTWESPNAGPVMAAGAGALQVLLGGGDYYHGHWKARPPLGYGHKPNTADLQRTIQLLKKALGIWLLLVSGGLLALIAAQGSVSFGLKGFL